MTLLIATSRPANQVNKGCGNKKPRRICGVVSSVIEDQFSDKHTAQPLMDKPFGLNPQSVAKS
jgi:hypothetical protein